MEKIIWQNEKRKLSELKEWKRNPRKATKKQAKDLAKSLEKFSLADPIIINRDNTIIGGHFRYRILKMNGEKTVDVRVPNRLLNEKEVEELSLRLNKNLGSWDYDLLANFDEKLLIDVGFEELDIESILKIHNYNEKKIELKDLKLENKCPKCGYEW